MPKFEFEGSILKQYSGEIEADSEDEARDILMSDMDWDAPDSEWTEIEWLEEVEE